MTYRVGIVCADLHDGEEFAAAQPPEWKVYLLPVRSPARARGLSLDALLVTAGAFQSRRLPNVLQHALICLAAPRG